MSQAESPVLELSINTDPAQPLIYIGFKVCYKK